jgi:hypothetical protein
LASIDRPHGLAFGPNPAPQYWSDDKRTAPGLTATFEVDPITRAVCFGVYERSLDAAACRTTLDRKDFPPSTSLSLGTALIGTVGHIYAAGRPHPWWDL